MAWQTEILIKKCTEEKRMSNIKNFFIELYYSKGHKIGMHLLTDIGIAAICVILLNISTGTKMTISGAFDWALTLPIFAIVIMAIRLALRLVHSIIPLPSGIVKIVADVIIIGIVIGCAGALINKIDFPQSNILQMIILIIFDIVYVAIMVFLLLAGKNEYDFEE
jgi:hypothetical protein